VRMTDYGVQIFRYGVVLHGDGRKRKKSAFGGTYLVPQERSQSHYRGPVRAMSRDSQRRLEFVSANLEGRFHSLLTLTYHAESGEWEADHARNRRIVVRSKKDLNRFLSCMRKELGAYLWVQEFQTRGVVHYHVLCTGEVAEERAALAWCRATGELRDIHAMRHAVKVEQIETDRAARGYVGRYVGKARQKCLPDGVEGAGRWWGRSRSLNLVMLDEVVSGEQGMKHAIPEGARITRVLRKYISKKFKRKFRGGMFLDWGGDLAAKLNAMSVVLKGYYGTPRRLDDLLDEFGWEAVDTGGEKWIPVPVLSEELNGELGSW
jgi:hypothetical protein